LLVRLPIIDETCRFPYILSCNYVILEGSDGPVKMIAISCMGVQKTVTAKSFIIEWQYSLVGDPGRVVQSSSCKVYDLKDPLLRCDFACV